MANGEYEEAVEAFQKSLSLGDNQMASSKLGCAYGLAGRRDEALKILDQLFEMRAAIRRPLQHRACLRRTWR
jgi:Flp pilus assembly protein TadD